MNKLKIGVIVGSNSKQSINRQLAQGLVHLAVDQADFEFLDISQLPMYNRDVDGTPAAQPFEAFKTQVRGCNGLLLVTPEHNRSVPGLLKNAIDAGSRPHGQSAWGGVPAAIIGTSSGGPATAMAQQHLRNILAAVGMPTMPQPEAFVRWSDGLIDSNGHIGPASKDFLSGYMSKFLAWVQLHQKR